MDGAHSSMEFGPAMENGFLLMDEFDGDYWMNHATYAKTVADRTLANRAEEETPVPQVYLPRN